MPFRRFFGYWACVIIGRWIGGLLGYKPFFREYTTDWDYAVAKMKGQPFTKRLIHDSFSTKSSWPEQVELSKGLNPRNAEYQYWVEDIAEQRSDKNKIATAGMEINDEPTAQTQSAKHSQHGHGESEVHVNGYATGLDLPSKVTNRGSRA